MFKKLLFVLNFLLLINSLLVGQAVSNILEDVTLPAPNAAALGKYGDVPVNYFTGVPNISIPIHTVNDGSISLPVSINYHASGVKMAETASWVGLGWSLSAGGMITRTIQNIPDETPVIGFYESGAQTLSLLQGVGGGSVTVDNNYDEAANGNLDSEADIFSFSVGGYSGKFMFDENKKVHFIPRQDLKIEVDWNAAPAGNKAYFQRFTIITPDGTKYHFGNTSLGNQLAYEYTIEAGQVRGNTFPRNPSSWYLVQIESANEQFHIDLSYTDEYYMYRQPGTCQTEASSVACGEFASSQYENCTGANFNIDGNFFYFLRMNVEGKRLTQITSSTETINFEVDATSGNRRKDLEIHTNFTASDKAYPLQSIEINTGTFCKSFELDYDYFVADNQDEVSTSAVEAIGMRLQLKSLQETTCSGSPNPVEIPMYEFEYEGNTFDDPNSSYDGKQTLPHRLTKAVDHWGFYNGKTINNSSYMNIPTTTIEYVQDSEKTYTSNSIRDSDENSMLRGMLTKIDYPTGGFRQYTYEANEYLDESTQIERSSYLSQELTNCTTAITQSCCSSPQVSTNYTFPDQAAIDDGKIELVLFHNSPYDGSVPCSGSDQTDTEIKLEIFPVGSSTATATFMFDYMSGLDLDGDNIEDVKLSETMVYECKDINGLTPLQAYEFRITTVNGRGVFDLFSESEVVANTAVKAGGVRIKQTLTHDGISTEDDIIKNYSYLKEDGKSSGILFRMPTYGYSGESSSGVFFSFNDVSVVPLSNLQGFHIGYERVVIEHNGNGNSVYEYFIDQQSVQAENIEARSKYPIAPVSYNQDNGELKSSQYFGESSNTDPLSSHIVSAPTMKGPIFFGLNAKITKINIENSCTQGYLGRSYDIAYNFYDKVTSLFLPSRVRLIEDGVETITDYKYSTYHNLAIETIVTNSDGKQYITRNQYPQDYGEIDEDEAASEAIGIYNLVEKHMIHTPVEVTQYVKKSNGAEQVLSSTLTEFKSTGFPYPDEVWKTEYQTPRYSGLFKPSHISSDQSTFIKDNDYQCHEQDLPSMTYNHYDNFGNPTEIQQTFDQSVALTWSYDGTRITSITKNAAYEEVAFTSFEHPYDDSDFSAVITDGGWNYKMRGVANSDNTYYSLTNDSNDDRIVYSNTNIPQGEYLISFWAYGAGAGAEKILIKKNNTTIFELSIENDVWKHYTQTITLGQNDTNAEISIDGDGGTLDFIYVDDLRLHPTDAMITSYAYAKNSNILTGTSDVSHRRTEYEYDDLIRLEAVRDFENYIVQAMDYNYADDSGNTQMKNYVLTQELIAKEDMLSSLGNLNITNGEIRRSYQYFDGLSRLIQTNQAEASPNENDLISFVEYDKFNRVKQEYLPFAYSHAIDPDGSFLDNPSVNQAAFYNSLSALAPSGEGNYAFSENTYEPSPLNRIASQNAPGQAWSKTGMDNAVTTVYRSNSNDAPHFDDVHDFTQGKRTADIYPNDALNVTEITDENGNVSRVYVDKIGRTVMSEQVLNATEVARTYTVYDDYNLPIAVIPPQLAADMDAADDWNIYTISNFRRIYAYQYDHRRLVKIKAVPGGGTTKLFYNKLDLPVMTIDNNGNKIITKYDILNRTILTGDYNGSQEPDNSTNADVFEEVDATKTHFYTLDNSFPTDADDANLLAVHSVTYYDDYDFNNNGTDNVTYIAPPNTTDYESTASPWTRNMVTSTKTGILEEDRTTNTFLEEHTFYDDRARVIQLQSDNHLGGQDKIFSSYNFPGWLLKSERQHSATVQGVAKNYTIKERYEYDHTGREIAMYHEIDNNGEIKTCAKTYDERNLLSQKTLHETSTGSDSYLQYIDYKYNIRGWMTDINDVTDTDQCVGSESTSQPIDLFSLHLAYNNNPNSNINPFIPQYNGNIAAMEWVNYACGERRAYAFTYDNFDRLTKAEQYFFGGNYSKVDRYGIPEIKYDLDGNIESLQRRGELPSSPTNHGLIDDLSYTYSTTVPNHLTTVTENVSNVNDAAKGFQGTSSYTYDHNGNLKTDSKKGFTMNYNYLNLPNKASFNTASFNPSNDFIEWQYDAMGQKLQKKVTASSSVSVEKEYCSGIEYNNGALEAIYFSEGRIVPDGTNWVYEYTLSDHLGNNRVTFKDDGMGAAELIDENHYYPFGMLIEDLTMRTNSPDNDYLYNGKELDEEFGLELQHYGFRLYDASIARFSSVDPIAEDFAFVSPFNYAENEPIGNIDLHGLQKVSFKKLALNTISYGMGVVNSMASNALGGAGRMDASKFGEYSYAFSNGQTAGDVASVAVGAVETVVGVAETIGGAAATPVTAGASLTVSAAGVATTAHGVVTTTTAIQNLTGNNSRVHAKDDGKIYEVPGDATDSGKPYVGRTKQSSPEKRGKTGKPDGRDRSKAKVIDTYDPSKKGQGAYKEQKAIDSRGGIDKLDNKRNERTPKKMKDLEKKYGDGN